MIKKFCLIFLFFILLSMSISSVDASDENIRSLAFGDNLRSNSFLTIQPSETALQQKMNPLEEYIIPVNITYKIDGLFANFMEKRLTSKTVKIDLTPAIYPDWCSVTITPESVTANINTTEVDINEELSVKIGIKEDALAFEKGTIKINATANEVKGPLNILTWINQKKFSNDFEITVGYIPDISITPGNSSYEISPINVTNTTINIKNNGNGKTTVLVNITEEPNNWNITIPERIDLEFGEDKDINLKIKPSKNFKQNHINITFTPYYHTEVPSEGTINTETIYRTFDYKNDGSYKEEKENGFKIDSTSILVIIIIVLAVILILIGIKIKRK